MAAPPTSDDDLALARSGAARVVATLQAHIETLQTSHARLSDVKIAEGRALAEVAVALAGQVLTRLDETPTS